MSTFNLELGSHRASWFAGSYDGMATFAILQPRRVRSPRDEAAAGQSGIFLAALCRAFTAPGTTCSRHRQGRGTTTIDYHRRNDFRQVFRLPECYQDFCCRGGPKALCAEHRRFQTNEATAEEPEDHTCVDAKRGATPLPSRYFDSLRQIQGAACRTQVEHPKLSAELVVQVFELLVPSRAIIRDKHLIASGNVSTV